MIPRDGAIAGALALVVCAAGLAAALLLPSRASRQAEPAPEALVGERIEGGGWLYALGYEPVMGSRFSAKAVFPEQRDPRAKGALEAALRAALAADKKISKYDPDSEVARAWKLKPGQSLELSAETFGALALSVDLWKRSGGAFDCTVQPLIDLYKFTGREERPPTSEEIAAALKKVGSGKLRLDPAKRTVAFSEPGMKFDLGAVGQGLGADLACEELRRAGATGALVELGGEVRAFGRKAPDTPWKIEIVSPRSPDRGMAVVELDGNAVSTSGDYQKFFKQGGKKASHILDPRTGKPLIGGAVSVTIIAPDCALADGLATAVSVLGPVEGLKLVESYRTEGRAVEALIIEETADGKLVPHLSPGLKGKIEVNLELPAPAPAPTEGK